MRGFFAIVDHHDNLIYEHPIPFGTKIDDSEWLNNQFLVYSSLDIIDCYMATTNNCYIRRLEQLKNICINAYVTPSGYKLILLSTQTSDENVRGFMQNAYKTLLMEILDPLYKQGTPLHTSPEFCNEIKKYEKSHF